MIAANIVSRYSLSLIKIPFSDHVRARFHRDLVVVVHQHIRRCVVNPIPGLAHALITKVYNHNPLLLIFLTSRKN